MAVAPPALDAVAHLEAELRRLDAVLAVAVDRQKAEGRWRGDDDLRGVYVAPAAAAAILEGRAGAAAGAAGSLDGDAPADLPLPLPLLADRFALDAFERFVLLLALAPEVDSRYGPVFGCLCDDGARTAPTVALALDLFAGAGPHSAPLRRAFRPEAPLVRYRLVRLRAAGGSLLRCGIELDDWVVSRALGDPAPHDPTEPWCSLEETGGVPDAAPADLSTPLVVVAEDRRAALDAARDAAGRPQLVADVGAAAIETAEALALAARRARVDGLALALDGDRLADAGHLAAQAAAIAADGVPVAVTARPADADALPDAWPRHALAPVSLEQRRERWRSGLADAGVAVGPRALDVVAGSHPLALDRIDAAVTRLAAGRTAAPRTAADLRAAAQGVARHGLGALARRVPPGRSWDDLVLPPRVLRQLREIAASIADRPRVLDAWGFGARAGGRGTHVLLSGASGTGKTLAASVIAEEAGYPLYAIDLAQVVDKYIGETEKRLDRVFGEAAAACAVLLFDEADALFGKRAEVRDARDRYANIEIAYLLQRLESHPGVTMLATNLGHHLDPAFARRLHHRVDFPVPDASLRERLWRVMLPDAAPLAGDLDLALVAERFELAGGAIRGAALGAAYRAAAARRPIAMADIVRAVAREMEKAGRPATRAEFRELYETLQREA